MIAKDMVAASSPEPTADAHATIVDDSPTPKELESCLREGGPLLSTERHASASFKDWFLLAIYSFAMFIDIWSYSSFFIFTDQISQDLDVPFQQQSWIITSYSITFASVLLFFGRLVDLYSPRKTFLYGFTALGLLNLLLSFLPERYSFFIFRAISGIAGASLIPASYRLITMTFTGPQLQMALTLYGVSGAIATVTGLIVSGVIDLIPGFGQMVAWRWFFRCAAALVLPVALIAAFMVPVDPPLPDVDQGKRSIRHLDLIGCIIMLFGLVLLVLGLTFGATYGFNTAAFLAPFIASIFLFPAFFYWETRVPAEYALIPPATWKIPNFACLAFLGLYVYGFFGTNFLAFADVYMKVYDETALDVALRLLPQGITSCCICLFLVFFPRFVSHPRWPIAAGLVLGSGAWLLWIFASDITGKGYWRYLFPGMVIGTLGLDTSFTSLNVGVILAAPPSQAGIASAILQVTYQIGSTIALAIQSGMFTTHPDSIYNWANIQASFWFEFGWGILALVVFLSWYRPAKERAGLGDMPVGHV